MNFEALIGGLLVVLVTQPNQVQDATKKAAIIQQLHEVELLPRNRSLPIYDLSRQIVGTLSEGSKIDAATLARLELPYLATIEKLEHRFGIAESDCEKLRYAVRSDFTRIYRETQQELISIPRSSVIVRIWDLDQASLFHKIINELLTDSQQQEYERYQVERMVSNLERPLRLSPLEREQLVILLFERKVPVPFWDDRLGDAKMNKVEYSELEAFLPRDKFVILVSLCRRLPL